MFSTTISSAIILLLSIPLFFGNVNSEAKTLATHSISLQNRTIDPWVNKVFKDNILLAVTYTAGEAINKTYINWKDIEKPFEYTLSLEPGETFAFHDDVLPEYKGKIHKTTNSHFNGEDGYRSSGYLFGDGVCHFASLLYWVAKESGLTTVAPVRHDFANIPEIKPELGVSIYSSGSSQSYTSQVQNLYITNNKDKTIHFIFSYDGSTLTITATS